MAIDSPCGETQSAPATKKPYQKPDFRFEEVFVTSALTCGKISDTDSNCTFHMSAS